MTAMPLIRRSSLRSSLARVYFALFCGLFLVGCASAQTPAVGAKAPNFTLSTPSGKPIQMSKDRHGQSLVLIVLRGYPGYQCPYCVKQVHDFVEHAPAFAAKNARVLLVYPGPLADLDLHAREFLEKQADLPANVTLVTDPDYKVTNQYGLRWEARSTRQRILRPSSSIRAERLCSRRLAVAMVTGFPLRMHSIILLRNNHPVI